jgi:hypothetical protein
VVTTTDCLTGAQRGGVQERPVCDNRYAVAAMHFHPIWRTHPRAWHGAFPSGSLGAGRALLRQIHRLELAEIGADAELDIVQPRTPLADFYPLSMIATAGPLVEGGVLTREEAEALVACLEAPDFPGCGFAHIGVWGRRPAAES